MVVVTDTSDVANAIGQATQIVDGRIVGMVVRTMIRRRIPSSLVVPFELLVYGSNFGTVVRCGMPK